MSNDAWRPELDEDALKELIRKTMIEAGGVAPGDLPSKIRERIKGRAVGELDIEAYIKQIQRELKKGEA